MRNGITCRMHNLPAVAPVDAVVGLAVFLVAILPVCCISLSIRFGLGPDMY